MKYIQQNNPNRQKRIRTTHSAWPIAHNPINTLEKLREQLQTAMKIELATIPPYLCALYSIKEGTNTIAAQIIQSVVMEEMLHMILAANILNAIGGHPKVDKTITIDYPDYLPENDNNFKVNLLKFSPEAIDTFLLIEKPAQDVSLPTDDKFHSIGQFYTAVMKAMEDIEDQYKKKVKSIFTGDIKRQITPEHYYGGGGTLTVVTSLDTAKKAIEEIIGQGEGIDGSIDDGDPGTFGRDMEVAHYFRFMEISHGRFYIPGDSPLGPPSGPSIDIDWDGAYHMEPNPKMANYKHNPVLYKKAESFNLLYTRLLQAIHATCNGHPEALKPAIPIMWELKYLALELMKVPLTDSYDSMTAGPSFEYIP